MGTFVGVELKTNAAELVAEALERWAALMQAKYPGWKPQPAGVITIAIEVLGPLAADVQGVAAVVPEAVYRAFGTRLLGVPFNEGAAATASTLWTLTDTAGHTIPQGTQVAVGNFGFYVEKEVVVASGHSTAKVQLVAVEQGTEYNQLTGTAELVEAIDWVKEVTLEGETSGGANSEEDAAYVERIKSELQLQAPRPVNAADFAPFILDMPSTVLPSGVVVGRATSIDLYNAATKESGVPFCTSTWVADPEGKALDSEHMKAIEEWLSPYLAQNFLAPIAAPAYEKVYMTAGIRVASGYDEVATVAAVKAALEALANPATYGNAGGSIGGRQWLNEKELRYNTALVAAGKVSGVKYVLDGAEGLAIGTAPSPKGTSDITLSGGEVVLPETTGSAVVVTAK